MRELPTKYVLFCLGKVRDALESEGILRSDGTLLEQFFEVSEAMGPRELCSIIHELLVG